MKGAGGTSGGLSLFFVGTIMLIAGAWMFLDSVWVGTRHHGYIGRYVGGSTLITLAPLALGIFLLFFSSKNKVGWIVSIIGLLIIAVETISRLQFQMHMKLWQFIILGIFIIGGAGLILRSFKEKA